eukprot:TRINITY_DN63773_c0_g1_i1.p1 TRINITY_DN63773_c0_g1~~TRINITY_DN63773_c0_g1_i1.p1  ORF type:complete len:100 (-),score=8.07 TRINITY_DN63773_c0_g1_i1:65-364(-)
MLRSLVGSEMCIRDSHHHGVSVLGSSGIFGVVVLPRIGSISERVGQGVWRARPQRCLLYTSDAADEEDSVDLGGRRIIKKTKIDVTITMIGMIKRIVLC